MMPIARPSSLRPQERPCSVYRTSITFFSRLTQGDASAIPSDADGVCVSLGTPRTAFTSLHRNASVSGKSKKTGNLVALGSAAVVAVYGAGFMRTAAAAERFAEQSDERVLSPEDAAATRTDAKPQGSAAASNVSNAVSRNTAPVGAPSVNVSPVDAPLASTPPSGAPPAGASPAATPPARAIAARPNKADATIAKADSKAVPNTSPSREVSVPVPPEVTTVIAASGALVSSGAAQPTVSATSAPATAPTAKPVAEKPSASVAATTSAPVSQVTTAPVTATPAVTAPAASVAAPVTPSVATASAAPTNTDAAPKLKDGEYTGYGTSRHGDVEVYLETTDGKITYVKISQCLTQYSCSWISDLPKQVLARQSARVDGVSGATQSANAFYYAVVQALAKAK